MNRGQVSLIGVLVTVTTVGCDSDPTFADPRQRADTVWVDEPIAEWFEYKRGELVLGRQVYQPCVGPGTWLMNRFPARDSWVLDLYFANGHQGSFSELIPANILEVQESGAEIIKTFNMNVIRVRATREHLVWLTPARARIATSLDRFDVEVIVGFSDDSVVTLFEDLGGFLTTEPGRSFRGVIPDVRIPALRADPAVGYLYVPGLGCDGIAN